MASLYSKRFQTLPLADALALAMFQRWLASVLLFRHLFGSGAAGISSSGPTEAVESARSS
jgi:hypothetical protein